MIIWSLKNKTILKANKKHLLNIIKRTLNRVILSKRNFESFLTVE